MLTQQFRSVFHFHCTLSPCFDYHCGIISMPKMMVDRWMVWMKWSDSYTLNALQPWQTVSPQKQVGPRMKSSHWMKKRNLFPSTHRCHVFNTSSLALQICSCCTGWCATSVDRCRFTLRREGKLGENREIFVSGFGYHLWKITILYHTTRFLYPQTGIPYLNNYHYIGKLIRHLILDRVSTGIAKGLLFRAPGCLVFLVVSHFVPKCLTF